MPRKFHCSSCGLELIHSRKAVPGKGLIFDLIAPHECEGYSIKSNIDKKPTVQDILDNLKGVQITIEKATEKISGKRGFPILDDSGDKRRDKKTSTAPESLQSNIKNLSNSEPASELD